jgi:hypothetical protein
VKLEVEVNAKIPNGTEYTFYFQLNIYYMHINPTVRTQLAVLFSRPVARPEHQLRATFRAVFGPKEAKNGQWSIGTHDGAVRQIDTGSEREV